MSHFTVLVIGDEPEEQLAPYHEFECTGTIDKYVQNIDILPKAREKYNTRKVHMLKSPEGQYFDPLEDRFYRDPTKEEAEEIKESKPFKRNGIYYCSKDWGDGKGIRPKIKFIPEGYEKAEVPVKDVMTFQEFVEREYERDCVPEGQEPDINETHKYGWMRVNSDGEVIELVRRTNPNAKWDWYSLGGRWTGYFKLKKLDPNGTLPEHEVGRPGIMTPRAEEGWADSAMKKDIDFEGMRDAAGQKAKERYERLEKLFGGSIPKIPLLWKDISEGEKYKNLDIDSKRKLYWDQEPFKTLHNLMNSSINNRKEEDEESKKDDDALWQFRFNPEDFMISKEDYIQAARDGAISTFAVVKDGKWYEKGEMGWWAIVSNEKDEKEWQKEFTTLLDSLPDDTLLSVVDCHI